MSFNKHVFKEIPSQNKGGNPNNNIKHLMFNETDKDSLSLNNRSGMKRRLNIAQEGAQVQEGSGQGQMEQLVAQVQKMLQQAPPEQVIAQLLQQLGDPNAVVQIMSAATQSPPEQIMPIVQQVAQQMQSGGGQPPQNAQEEQAEGAASNPAEEAQEVPAMGKGGLSRNLQNIFSPKVDQFFDMGIEHPPYPKAAFGTETHMMPDGSMMANDMMPPASTNPFEGLFGKRYGENDWFNSEFHPNANPNPSGVSGTSRDIHDSRDLARKINKRIRTGVVDDQGMDYSQFAKVHGRDFVVKDELGSFGSGGEFDVIRKEMLKTFGGGGSTDKSIDDTTTENYVTGLKKALQEHMYKGYAINKINTDFKAISDKAALPPPPMPKAADGYEVGSDKFKNLLTQNKYTAEQYNSDPTIKAEVDAQIANARRGNAPLLGNQQSSQNQNVSDSNINPSVGEGTVGERISQEQKHYYPGYGPGQPSDPFGYQREKFSMTPLSQVLGSFGKQRGPVTATGFGDFEGKGVNDFLDAINKTHEVVDVAPVYKENIFGKEKRHTDRNIIGKRFTTQLRDGQPFANPNVDVINNTPNVQAGPGNFAYDANGDAIPDYLQNFPTPSSTGTDSNLASALGTVNNRGALVPAPTFEERVSDRWGRKSEKENAQNFLPDGTPMADTQGYGQGANAQTGTSQDKQDALFNQVKTTMGLPMDFDVWSLPDTDPRKQQFLDMADELDQFMCGGATHKKMMKAENGFELQQQNKMTFEPSSFAYGIEGMGQGFSNFLDKLNSYQSPEEMAANRSPDAVFKPSPRHSGDEGIYWANLQRQMGQDMGADVLAGTGSDWAGFSSNKGQSFKDDFFRQQTPFAEGGVSGMNRGDEVILNDDQMKKLESLGYSLKRKY